MENLIEEVVQIEKRVLSDKQREALGKQKQRI
jgi:hypothetical protein